MADQEDIEVGVVRTKEAMILRPVGEIDLGRAPALRDHLSQALRHGLPRLIIDLREVPYMDSSGVATFVEAMQVARKRGTTLILCGLQDRVRSILEIARLDMVFNIRADTEEALSA